MSNPRSVSMDQDQSVKTQAEISRLVAETSRLVAETSRFNKETDPGVAKLMAETTRLSAETAKLNKETRWYELVIITGCVVAVITITKLFL